MQTIGEVFQLDPQGCDGLSKIILPLGVIHPQVFAEQTTAWKMALTTRGSYIHHGATFFEAPELSQKKEQTSVLFFFFGGCSGATSKICFAFQADSSYLLSSAI